MAHIRIPSEDRVIADAEAIRSFLRPHGIEYDCWPLAGRVESGAEASATEILLAYEPEVEALKQRGGYSTADVVNVTPETPGLQGLLDKFNQEHRHAEDEVRFVVKGGGVFYIHPEPEGAVFSIELEPGDFINVPAGIRHWFDLCADRCIRAIRLFKDPSGWTPLYTGDAIAAGYQPLCFGPGRSVARGLVLEPAVVMP